MDHGSGGLKIRSPKEMQTVEALAQGVSEGSQGLIRMCARFHYGYIQARIWLILPIT